MYIKAFLERPRFLPDFPTDTIRKDFYKDIRCGILHPAQAKKKWLIRRNQQRMLDADGYGGYILDIGLFHTALKLSFDDYLAELLRPEEVNLRTNLWKKMDHICNERLSRGANYGSDTAAASPTA